MQGKTIINISKPITQTTDSVKALLAWRGHPTTPLPTDVSLENGRLVLVLSNRKDCYYTVTAAECSCPARSWHPGSRCKHQRRYFPEQTAHKPVNAGSWHGCNGPVDPDELKRPAAKAPSIPLIDTLGEPNNRELAYWSIEEDKALWPAEA